MTISDIAHLSAHEHDGQVFVDRREVMELLQEHHKNIRIVLEAFETGVFIRNTSRDNEPGWTLTLMQPLAALAAIQRSAYE